MSENNSTVRLLSYQELMLTLQGLLKEKQSGVMVIHSESEGIAQLTLEQGEIFDVNFGGMNGKLALLQIKKIAHGKVAFFKRAQGSATQHIDLSSAEILQILTNSAPAIQKNVQIAQSQVTDEEKLTVIEAHLAAIIGPVARIICSEFREEIQQTNDLNRLSSIIEKIAQQTLSPEKQKLFKQNIRTFIANCGSKDPQVIMNIFKSTRKELKLHPLTLSLCIQKNVKQNSELRTTLLTRLVSQIEQAGNLASVIKLSDLLKFLEKTTKTGLLAIEFKGKKAGFYFNQGVLINAFDGDKRGVAVALQLLQWEPDTINFVSMDRLNVVREIPQTVDILLSNMHTGIISKQEALKYYTPQVDKNDLSAGEIQAALSKGIEHLQGKELNRIEIESGELLAKAILLAENYDNVSAEQLLSQVLLARDDLYDGWFWLARVLTNMTAIEFALKKAATLNSKSAELADDVKKFTAARKLVKSDFVLRCPFCWMPVKEKDHECPHCLANFFIDRTFFSKVGKAKTDVLDKAIARYSHALQHNFANSDNIYLLFYLAMAYLNRQYYQEGLAQLNEIAKLAPENRALLQQDSLLINYMQSAGLISSVTQPTAPCTTEVKAKILVVEDSVVTRKVIVRTLTANCYEVFEAKNAEEALTDIVERNPDLVLLDIILPGRDGYEILAEIRLIPSLAKVPVILLTSRDSLFDKLKGKVSDANEYLTKPFQPNELLLVVKKYLK